METNRYRNPMSEKEPKQLIEIVGTGGGGSKVVVKTAKKKRNVGSAGTVHEVPSADLSVPIAMLHTGTGPPRGEGRE